MTPPSSAPARQIDWRSHELVLIALGAAWLLGIRFGICSLAGMMKTSMSSGFLVLSPLALGCMHVVLALRRAPRGLAYCVFAPWGGMLAALAGAYLLGLEGVLCITFATPLLLVFSSLGGVWAWAWRRQRDAHQTRLYMIFLLPVLAMLLLPQPREVQELYVEREFAATPQQVWEQILSPGRIEAQESREGLIWRIGAPRPLSVELQARADHQPHGIGSVRHSAWQRGVSFDEVLDSWRPQQELGWTYRFHANSFPRGSIDLHIAPNNNNLQFLHTRYRILPAGAGRVKLEMRLRYRLESGVNWYLRPLSRWLLADGAQAILALYEKRVQQAAIRGADQ